MQVNGVETAGDLVALRRSVQHGTLEGSERWQHETARRLGLESTLNPLGRPRNGHAGAHAGTELFTPSSHHSEPP